MVIHGKQSDEQAFTRPAFVPRVKGITETTLDLRAGMFNIKEMSSSHLYFVESPIPS